MGVALATALAAPAALASTASAVGLPAAAAAPATLTTSILGPPLEQSLTSTVSFAGTTPHATALRAVVRPAGGAACGSSFTTDEGREQRVNDVLESGSVVPGGAYETTAAWTPAAPGTYLICAWIGASEPVSTAVTVRGPQVPALSVAPDATPSAARPFELRYTTETDQPLTLTSVIRPAGGACAADQQADRALERSDHVVFPGGVAIDGGPEVSSVSLREPAGSYLICTWVVGPRSGEVDAMLATPLSVAATPAAAAPDITLTSLTASTGSGISLAGRTADGLTGELAVTASCNGSHSSGSASARSGRFTAHFGLPLGCDAGARLVVRARWAGTAAFAVGHATRTATVTAGRAPRAGPLLFSRIIRHRRRFHDVFLVRPRSIVIGEVTLRIRWSRWTQRWARGRGVVREAHRRYPVTVRATRVIGHTFACLAVTRVSAGHARTTRYGLGRLGHSTYAWLSVDWLHRRASGARPWPRPGCPRAPAGRH